MKASLQNILDTCGIMVIDGSMSTALENMGLDLNHRLWTAKALAENPELVKQVHINYFRAGADCGITCSYQASIPGLMSCGYSAEEAEELIRRSVRLFLDARDEWWEMEGRAAGRAWPLCLAGMGPYGAYLADGSEYTGAYQVSDDELIAFHTRRAKLLLDAGADILLFETQPSLHEALLEARIAEELCADYWISFSCRDGQHNGRGEAIAECAAALSLDHPHLQMIGVNCVKPEHVESLIRCLKSSTTLPIAVYPNSGEVYDPVTKTWTHAGGDLDFGTYALRYMAAGVNAVGGCCTTVETHIRQVADAREQYLAMNRPSLIPRKDG
jgi:homocysteine S-methyltransferase